MQHLADLKATATQARETFLQCVVNDVPAALQAVEDRLRLLSSQSAPPVIAVQRRECWSDVQRQRSAWTISLLSALQRLHASLASPDGAVSGMSSRIDEFSLVDDDTMEREVLASRLALAIADQAASEFNDLRSRLDHLEQREEMPANDFLRPHVLARVLLDSWRAAELGIEAWRTARAVLHDELGHLVARGYHDTNRWLIEREVLPEIDLRPLIRRVPDSASGTAQPTEIASLAETTGIAARARAVRDTSHSGDDTVLQGGPATAYQSTRLMTRVAAMQAPASRAGQSALGQLSRLVSEQVTGFGAPTRRMQPTPPLLDVMADVERQLAQQLQAVGPGDAGEATATALLDGINETRQVLKNATESPIERATIEIVALLFQSILMEDRLPASVRVWFARLQMPVLRVAITEPDFFASTDHPARKLIDRMGACAMGFDAGTAGAMGPAMEAEIKRVVQVVEAYPDTGRRVFQTVLNEFEKFLEDYFRNENAVSRVGVSLAQQVEQRETLSIQYMIELRKMLNEVPVQDGIRDFLFQVWADVLATTAVKAGVQSEQTRQMKRAAADLIWSASAKVTREERAEVIRRLPPLLKTLREGMGSVGLAPEQQDRHIQLLNNALAAAFTAKTAAIPGDRLDELMLRLETLEELLPGGADIEIDEAIVRDLSAHQSAELEVVGEGGSMPSPQMIAWARGIQVGHWFKLDYRGRNEPVQLAWQGMRKQLSLFASPSGRCVLFQQHRLASFLQAGLLVPAEDEALTVKATRVALAKLDADPSRLLN